MESVAKITNHPVFRWAIISIIFVNALLIGYEIQHPSIWLNKIQAGFLCFFALELLFRYFGERNFTAFMKNPWNVFDLILVVVGSLPSSGAFDPDILLAFRTLRILRVLRLLRSMNDVKITVIVLLKSLKALTATAFLLLVFMYLFALVGIQLFKDKSEFRNPAIAPDPYGTVQESMFTLMRIMSGEDWTDIRYSLQASAPAQYYSTDIYHVTWLVLSSFLLLNLIVGAIVINFDQVMRSEARKHNESPMVLERLSALKDELINLEKDLHDSYIIKPKQIEAKKDQTVSCCNA